MFKPNVEAGKMLKARNRPKRAGSAKLILAEALTLGVTGAISFRAALI